jgi:predicted  nucleic acid-binding Zn-ribbon protein
LSEFRDKVQALERDVADEKTKSNKMQASYEMRLRAQQREIREANKQLVAVLQELQETKKQLDAARKSLTELFAVSTFTCVFAVGVLCVKSR